MSIDKNSHRLTNQQIVALLKEVLAAMEVKNVNRFRIRAYQNAIAVLDNLTTSIQDIWEEGRLGEIPGIGENADRGRYCNRFWRINRDRGSLSTHSCDRFGV